GASRAPAWKATRMPPRGRISARRFGVSGAIATSGWVRAIAEPQIQSNGDEDEGFEHKESDECSRRATVDEPGERTGGDAEENDREKHDRRTAACHNGLPVGDTEHAGAELHAL